MPIERYLIVKKIIPCAVAHLVVASCCWGVLGAEIIDFESGFQRLYPITSVKTAHNTVTFATAIDSSLIVANVGIPKDGFEVVVPGGWIYDIPTGGNPGSFFASHGPERPANYLFDLEWPISEFSLDLYDYRGDGGARPTDFATLRAFADRQRTVEVDTDQYIVPVPHPTDGLVVSLGVAAPSIGALTLEFSTPDRGTGIDNIRFVTIPEPGTLVLLVLGMLALRLGTRTRQ